MTYATSRGRNSEGWSADFWGGGGAMTVGGWCRALRAGVFAAVCVLLAAVGHAVMSGTSVPWWAVAGGGVVVGAVGWGPAGREQGSGVIVSGVVAVQAVLHETFAEAQSLAPVGRGVPASGGGMSHMAHMTHAAEPAPHTHGMATAPLGMIAAHLLAAVLCGLWLAHGERAVFRLLSAVAVRLAAPLRMLLAVPVLHHPPAPRRRPGDHPAPARLLLRSFVTSRGPPTGAAAFRGGRNHRGGSEPRAPVRGPRGTSRDRFFPARDVR
ncbi:hypothetical protein [Streptomyces acidiscabies]|uniref:hypothetical protein n=1 Tax=Streptomyces acidiscabies TaxID=42234 RepID=UPI0038F60F0E